jgi:ribosomal protein S18 acetylase RimI-like enzyme
MENITIRKASKQDCLPIAELALMAGEGIPAYFWEQSRKPGQNLTDVGAHNAASESENFSYRNVHLALINEDIAGMLLAYKLPDSDTEENLEDYPEFIRPLIELEQCVPNSFYINMIATYPQYRNKGVGKALMNIIDSLATEAGCKLISIEVFEQNEGALRLYQRLGYKIIEKRKIIPHSSHPYSGNILLLTRIVNQEDFVE